MDERLKPFEDAMRLGDLSGAYDAVNAIDPAEPHHLMVKGSILMRLKRVDEAIQVYEQVNLINPLFTRARLDYGHALRAKGDVEGAIKAYRKAAKNPDERCEAYWLLSNIKEYEFSAEEIRRMENIECRNPEDAAHIAFALGRAYENLEDYDRSFQEYQLGNLVKECQRPFNATTNMLKVEYLKYTFDKNFFRYRGEFGNQEAEPIFIVGLPRAGSTLVEQILASHSDVEGVGELHNINNIVARLNQTARKFKQQPYPENVTMLSEKFCKRLAGEYLDAREAHRSTDATYLVDKMPNNFFHIGLIFLLFPNAKVIDIRRKPIAACFANFKQMFVNGQLFSNNLTSLGRYYSDYYRLMVHWARTLPGAVLNVQYEDLVNDPSTEIKRILGYCGLPYEASCERFYENDRVVNTPSCEQVRQPIYKSAVDHWKHYAPYLDELKTALSPHTQ